MSTLYNILAESPIYAILLIVLGYFVARILSKSIGKGLKTHLTHHQGVILRRVIFYSIFILFLVSAGQQMGFHIDTLLGATGILTIAIGIASQTSLSNIVSGIFIIGEKPFEIGDTIKVNDIQGEVKSIDLLSVKIRTSDNTVVRIPNETLIKSAIINTSYYPTRRVDILLNIAYKENIAHIRKILLGIAAKNAFCLKEPKPSVTFTSFGDAFANMQFSVWTKKDTFNELKTEIQEEIKNAFDENKIEMPFPLPIKIIS